MRKTAEAAARKLRAKGGLTVLELLVTVLLVTLIGGIITATVDLAAKQFRDRTLESDAQLLCSALSLFVQSELTYAGDMEIGDSPAFTDHTHNLGPGCSFAINEGRLVLQYPGGSYELVGTGSYRGRNKALTAEQSIYFDGAKAVVKIDILSDGKSLASNEFKVQPVAP